jgi:hypothetical protein
MRLVSAQAKAAGPFQLTIPAGIEDDVVRRDSLHAVINSLPDPNYATLRALTLVTWPTHLLSISTNDRKQHLNRVQEHSLVNRMNAGNLAICFGYASFLFLSSTPAYISQPYTDGS